MEPPKEVVRYARIVRKMAGRCGWKVVSDRDTRFRKSRYITVQRSESAIVVRVSTHKRSPMAEAKYGPVDFDLCPANMLPFGDILAEIERRLSGEAH